MKKEEIISVLKELHAVTGFRLSLHGTDFTEIAAYPAERLPFCKELHKNPEEFRRCISQDIEACKIALESQKTYIYTCRCGLTEVVSPLYNYGALSGFLMMGQIVIDDGEVEVPIGAPEVCRRLKDSICRVKGDIVNSYIKIMTICAEYLTLSNAVPSERPSLAEVAYKYLYDNYKEKVSIDGMCAFLGCSRSTLINAFKKKYDMTVNTALNEIRLDRAKQKLIERELTVSEIAIECGFADQSYFSKVFSHRFGISPSEFRQGNGGTKKQ